VVGGQRFLTINRASDSVQVPLAELTDEEIDDQRAKAMTREETLESIWQAAPPQHRFVAGAQRFLTINRAGQSVQTARGRCRAGHKPGSTGRAAIGRRPTRSYGPSAGATARSSPSTPTTTGTNAGDARTTHAPPPSSAIRLPRRSAP